MTNTPAEMEQALDRVLGALDRDSSVPLSVQLRGAIEFGIGSGILRAGTRLPSVRAMAARCGLSPVTVSGVYSALQEAGHIEARVGAGTYVSGAGPMAIGPVRRSFGCSTGRLPSWSALVASAASVRMNWPAASPSPDPRPVGRSGC